MSFETAQQVPHSASVDERLSPEIAQTLRAVSRQQMSRTALLFLAGHRPLGFVIGQVLYVASPLADLAGWGGCADWAAVFSHPKGLTRLEQMLEHGLQQND